jgi:hypothetical protein
MFGSAKKFLLIGFVLVLLAVIPLTVYFLQEQQRTQSQAAKASNLSFVRTTTTPLKVGDEFDVQIRLDPGTNQVIASKLVITYDTTRLDKSAAATCSFAGIPATSAFCPDAQAFTNVLEGPIFTSGQMSITLTVGVDITKAIQTPKTIATIKFRAISAGTTPLAFGTGTNVTSASDPETNVIAQSPSLDITIGAGTTTPTVGPTTAATPTTAPTTGAATPTSATATVKPTTSLTVTPTTSVSATPTSIVMTASPTTALTTITPPGPGNTILTIGALGAIISIVGGLLFFSL